MIKVSQEAQRKFWDRVDKRGPDECWPWTGAMSSTNNAYGRFWCDGRMRPATQVSWEIANGAPFPEGKFACHSCDNPPCVNPAHIWPGTNSENLRDAVEKGLYAPPKWTHCKRGHELTEENRHKLPHGECCLICFRRNNRERVRRYRARQKALRGMKK